MSLSRKALLLLLLLLWSGPAYADYKSSFDAGRVASERQEWARVQSTMRQALSEEPNPSADTKIKGFGYLPKFYLGLAAFYLNDCPAALELLADQATVAAMRGREVQRQELMVRSCKNRLAAAERAQTGSTAATNPTPPPLEPAVATPVRIPPASAPRVPLVTAPRSAATPAVAGGGNDPKRVAALRELLVVIDSNLKSSSQTLADPAMVSSSAPWQPRFNKLTSDVRRVRASISTLDRNADLSALAKLERELAAISQGAIVLKQALGAAQQQARTAALAANAATVVQQRQLRAQLTVTLRPMLDAFFAGQYAKIASWRLDPAFDRLPEAKAQALVLRAAARHAQFVLSGERDVALADQAKADVLEARRLVAQLQPSVRAYSPRFRRFFASAR